MPLTIISCKQSEKNSDVRKWSEEKINEWYQNSPWTNLLHLKPDAGIDKRLFVEQVLLNPKSWDLAFRFIRDSNAAEMAPGIYQLEDGGAYATVRDYRTKDSSHFEAHRNFIDVQMISKGQEYILVSTINNEGRTEVQPYDEEKDIEFFDKDNYERRLLTPGTFMIFFPVNAHQPNMMVDSVEEVRKIVIKIPYVKPEIEVN